MATNATSTSSVAVRLARGPRANGAFWPGDIVRGTVFVETTKPYGLRHLGLQAVLKGSTEFLSFPSTSLGSVGLFEALSGQGPESIVWVDRSIALTGVLREEGALLPQGVTEFDFELPVATTTNRALPESFKGVAIRTKYSISAVLARPGISIQSFGFKQLRDEVEILVHVPQPLPRPIDVPRTMFRMSESVCTVLAPEADWVPSPFVLRGEILASAELSSPVTGYILCERADSPIKTIEGRLQRVETVLGEDVEPWSEETCVLNLQLADGNIAQGLSVPFSFLAPRGFVAPTWTLPECGVRYAFELFLLFEDGCAVCGNVGIKFERGE